jgi:hypothetical protein
MTQRDIYQRKAYAIRRMSLAINRGKQATSSDDKENAAYWIKMWSAVSRIRRFKLGNGGADRCKSRPLVDSYPRRFDPL